MARETDSTFDYVNEIWGIADYVRDVIKRSEYNRIVLPFSLLRRLECALEPTRQDVVRAVNEHEMEWGRENDNYCKFSGKAFYNITNFRLNTLGATDTLDALMEYINGFSPNAREILVRFKMEETCKTLQESGMLYEVCRRFSTFDLSPENVSDRDMSNIYEHLIERFGETIAEDAEDFMTPKDIVRLAISMLFAGNDELMNRDEGDLVTLYDPTLGTGGFITDALDLLDQWHEENKDAIAPTQIVPYGQEIESESWAIAKANLLLRNVSDSKDIYDAITDRSSNIMWGDTLSDDKFAGKTFSLICSNPPYGKKWEKEQDAVNQEARLGFKGRFGAGLPSINDGSMLFLQHVVSKLDPVKSDGTGGGHAAIVLSGSPLSTGDAGSGPSNIRRWLFKQDVIDCIVKLPKNIFFRTGINTYLWILSNNKPEGRKGMIQLINASEMKETLRRPLGNKRYEINETQRDWIIKTYMDGIENEHSVIVPYTDFMFRKVTTQAPLHMKIILGSDKLEGLYIKTSDENKKILKDAILKEIKAGETEKDFHWADSFAKEIRKTMKNPMPGIPVIAKAIRDSFGVVKPDYPIVKDKKGNIIPDPILKDTENIPWGVAFSDYMAKEVLPYAPETWIDENVLDNGPLSDRKVGIVGANIIFNKYFYKYDQPREPEAIAEEITVLEEELKEFMRGIFNE